MPIKKFRYINLQILIYEKFKNHIIAGVEDRPPARRSEGLVGMKDKVSSIATRTQAFSLARFGEYTLQNATLLFPYQNLKNLFVLASLLLTVAVVGLSSFASKSYNKKAFSTVCFQYNGNETTGHPTSTEVVVAGSWSTPASASNCGSPKEVICVICFDNGTYPLSNGQLPFSPGSTFSNTVLAHYNSPGDDGLTFNGITFYFQPRP